MRHLTLPRFWVLYNKLPSDVRSLADKNHKLLKRDPYHPSLHLKRVGRHHELWSVRVGANYRALGRPKDDAIVWFWIGTHTEYNRLISK